MVVSFGNSFHRFTLSFEVKKETQASKKDSLGKALPMQAW